MERCPLISSPESIIDRDRAQSQLFPLNYRSRRSKVTRTCTTARRKDQRVAFIVETRSRSNRVHANDPWLRAIRADEHVLHDDDAPFFYSQICESFFSLSSSPSDGVFRRFCF